MSEEQISACTELEAEAECVAGLDGVCREGFCQINLCGNGQLDTYPVRGPEACDGELGRLACADVGADFGLTDCTLACSSDSSRCESFTWKRAITGTGPGRLVTTFRGDPKGDTVFVARGGLLSWRRGGAWRSAVRLEGAINIGDVVPVTAERALVVAPKNGTQLALWSFDAAADPLLTTTSLVIPTTGPTPLRWSGGVAMGQTRVMASLGTTLLLYQRIGDIWSEQTVTLNLGGCPTATPVRLHWWSPSENTIYGSMDSRAVSLAVSGTTVECTDLRDLGSPAVAMGGDSGLKWVVTRSGRVIDARDWQPLSLDPSESLALDSATVEVPSPLRLWATSGDDILLFDQGAWWKSTTGSAILRDDFSGRIPVHRPLAVQDNRVRAVLGAQEVGLVEPNSREWMTGWQTTTDGEVTELAVDGSGRTWTALFAPGSPGTARLALGPLIRVVSDLASAITSIHVVEGTMYLGTGNSVRKVTATTGTTITAVVEGSPALGLIRGLWSSGTTLYALSQQGAQPVRTQLYSKETTSATWTPFYDFAAEPCTATWMAGQVVASKPYLFAVCRGPVIPDKPRESKLLVFDLTSSARTVVAVPDGSYTRVAAGADGVVWLVGSQGRAVRVAPPYGVAELLPVLRRSPVTGKLSELSETLSDVVVLADGQVYVAGANQNLFWWDGARLVRVSASQGGSSSYVALAGSGSLLYAGYESGVDLLFRRVP
ncbi:MAG: hypothetical protein IPI49_06160 [Myxococcales bacterium]|nr:hypothetical protein [Myxococcales bacterium]